MRPFLGASGMIPIFNRPLLQKIWVFAKLFMAFTAFLLPTEGSAEPEGGKADFASIRGTPANARVGPGLHFPIRWQYRQRGLPVLIEERWGNWRLIADPDGDGGWMHRALLSSDPTAIIVDRQVPMLDEPSATEDLVALIEQGVVVQVEECLCAWCSVDTGTAAGWVQKKYLWGAVGNRAAGSEPADCRGTRRLLTNPGFLANWLDQIVDADDTLNTNNREIVS